MLQPAFGMYFKVKLNFAPSDLLLFATVEHRKMEYFVSRSSVASVRLVSFAALEATAVAASANRGAFFAAMSPAAVARASPSRPVPRELRAPA